MMGLLLGARPQTPHRTFPLLFVPEKKGSTKLPFFHHK